MCRRLPMFVPSVMCLGAALAVVPAVGVTIDFDYSLDTNKFFIDNPTARATLERAGAFYSDILTDTLSGITPGGGNTWDIRFTHPTTGLAPYDPVFNPTGWHINNPTIPADTLVVYVGGRNLSGTALGEAAAGGWGGSGSNAWFDTLHNRSQVGTTTGAAANEFAPWGGTLTLDSTNNWNDDWKTFPLVGQNDLYSVILHELAHVLGIGTADSWYSQVAGNTFTGPAATAVYGGNPPLQSGGGHWSPNTTSHIYLTPSPQEAALDPDILLGERKLPTDLDIAGLDDLGWTIAPPVAGDYDYDGTLDADDIDELFQNFGSAGGYNRARFNADGNAVIDQLDADHWITALAATQRGDFDLDGDVDFLDAIHVLFNYTGTTAPGSPQVSWASGNTDGDGDIDFIDAMTVRQHFAFSEPDAALLGLSPQQAAELDGTAWVAAVEQLAQYHGVPEPLAVWCLLLTPALRTRRPTR